MSLHRKPESPAGGLGEGLLVRLVVATALWAVLYGAITPGRDAAKRYCNEYTSTKATPVVPPLPRTIAV
jgi:hypothetical protein